MDEEKYEKRQDYDLSQIIQADITIRPVPQGAGLFYAREQPISIFPDTMLTLAQ
ncbi:hypothetical protein J28TS4_33160 [Paenibacillus lautus]|nr:hypothetical protein J28TS4_33160 [Paenibacillus lautus]